MSEGNSTILDNKPLLFVLAAAFVLRFVGVWYGLPAVYNSDEPFNVVNALAYGAKGSLEPTYFVYPALYSYALLVAYGIYYVLGRVFGGFTGAVDFGAAYFIDPTGLFLAGRCLSVLFGVAAVWVVYRLGERFFSPRVGLFAAIALTLSYAHTDTSHWVLPEALLVFLSAAGLFAIFKLSETPSLKHAVVAGLVCGLAISTKYNAGFLVLPLTIALLTGVRTEAKSAFARWSAGFVVVVAGFLLGSPYWIFSFSDYWQNLGYTFSHVSSGMVGHLSSAPGIWPLIDMIFVDRGVGLLFVTGLLFALFGREKKQLLLLTFIVPTLLVTGFWQRSGLHYLLPIFPALAVLAGIFLDRLWQLKLPPAAKYAGLTLLLLSSLCKIVLQDIRLCGPDSRTLAQKWIETNIPDESRIAYENYVYGPNLYDPVRFIKNESESQLLPLALRERLLQHSLTRRTYRLVNLRKDFRLKVLARADTTNARNAYVRQLLETRLPRLASVREAGVTYLVASSDNYDRYFKAAAPEEGTPLWLNYQNGRKFYSGLFESPAAKLLKEFEPGFWSPGPEIRIYQLEPENAIDETTESDSD